MNEEQIKELIRQYITEGLTISCVEKRELCGGHYIKVSIKLDGEEISSDWFDMPDED